MEETVKQQRALMDMMLEMQKTMATMNVRLENAEINQREAEDRAKEAQEELEKMKKEKQSASSSHGGAGETSGQQQREIGKTGPSEWGRNSFTARYVPENFDGREESWRDWKRPWKAWASKIFQGRIGLVLRAITEVPTESAFVSRLKVRPDLRDMGEDELMAILQNSITP